MVKIELTLPKMGDGALSPFCVVWTFLKLKCVSGPTPGASSPSFPYLQKKSHAQAHIAKNRIDSQSASIKNYHA